MQSKLCAFGFVFLAVVLPLAACEQLAPTPTTTVTPAPTQALEQEWPIPTDKYVFIERWIEIYEDSAMSVYIDFPTYSFDQNSGELKPDIVPPGRWFPLQDLTNLKVVYGRGTSRAGQAGMGAQSQVFALTELPFTEPQEHDTEVMVTIESIDGDGIAYLRRAGQQIVLHPGEQWTWDGKSAIEWGGVKSEILSKERISNFGVLDKSRIELIKATEPTSEPVEGADRWRGANWLNSPD